MELNGIHVSLLRSYGSRQIPHLPSEFSLTTSEFTQLVAPSTGVIIPCPTTDSIILSLV